jgi:hypothetical protein
MEEIERTRRTRTEVIRSNGVCFARTPSNSTYEFVPVRVSSDDGLGAPGPFQRALSSSHDEVAPSLPSGPTLDFAPPAQS